MRVLLLADGNSSHTIKWVKGLAGKGVFIGLWSLSEIRSPLYEGVDNVVIQSAGIPQKRGGLINKVRYLTALRNLNSFIRFFKPDIVHAHYASSYGLLGCLTKFHPLIISVWGSDVFDFPRKSFIHKTIFKYNLANAERVLSTSNIMANEIKLYTDKPVEVTPFGIDLNIFRPFTTDALFLPEDFAIGCIKALEKVYGLEFLLKAFSLLKKKYQYASFKLLLVGGGSMENDLKKLAKELDIEKDTVFVGKVSYEEIAQYHNILSVAVYPSVQESFGVSVIESAACEKAVIVSDTGGLPELVEEGVTGLIVPSGDSHAIAEALEKLYLNKELRESMGRNGRKRVEALYNWTNNVVQMQNIYHKLINNT